MLSLRPVLTRAGWGLADQALSSLTNFTLGVLIARTVGVEEFGAFSLAFLAYTLVMSVCRAYPMEPLTIRYSEAPDDAFRAGAAAAVGSVLAVGLASSLVLLLIGLVVKGGAGEAFLALAITMPGLLVQDAWRSMFFAWRKGRSAFANDLVWTVVMFPLLAVVIASGDRSVFWPTFVWGASATVAASFGWWQSRIRPNPRRARAWWHEHIDLGPRFITEVLARAAGGILSSYGIGVVAGLTTLGIIRAAQLVVGPVQIFFLGIGLIAVPEGVRALGFSRARLRRLAIRMSAVLMSLSAAWGLFVLLLPHEIGVNFLGRSWDPAQLVLVPIILAQVAAVATAGPGMGLKTLAAARRSLRANAVISVAIVVLGVGGAAAWGTLGAAWGLAVAIALGAVIWWRSFAAAMHEPIGGVGRASAPSVGWSEQGQSGSEGPPPASL